MEKFNFMKKTEWYQAVMETVYISTQESSVEMKRFESGPAALTVLLEPMCCAEA